MLITSFTSSKSWSKVAALFLLLSSVTAVSAQTTQCTLKSAELPHAPELFGFHLGMTAEQAKAHLPQIDFGKLDDLGVSKTTINPGFDPRTDQQAYAGVRSISLEFLDARISSLWLGYESYFKWQTVPDFVAGISQSLHLPNAWEPWKLRGSQIRCADFQIILSTMAGGASLHLIDNTAEQTIAARRAAKAEEAESDSDAEIIGDKRNKVYYSESCPAPETLEEKNRLVFKTKLEAETAGYKPAKNCN